MVPEFADYRRPDERDLEIFAATVPENHYLCRVKAVINFERARDDLVACYCAALGRPALEPILLLKLEFLQFHYNLSDRRVLEQARVNMAFRSFLDLSLHSPLPHHTLLTKFRNRLGVDKHQAVFEDIVAQAREYGLVKDRLRLKDATHVLANIAIPSTIRLVSQTRQQLLAAVRPYASDHVREEEQHADTLRTATADLAGEERLLQRVHHLRAIVAWVEVLVAAWGPPPPEEEAPRQAVRDALAIAHHVLADRDKPKSKRKRGRTKKDKKDVLVSVQDPDARWGKHGERYAGYLLDVTADADSEIITAVNVLPGNGDEPADATTLIQQEEQAQGNVVEALSLDGVGFRGPLLRQWTDPQGLNLEVIVPATPEPASAYFTARAFTPDASGRTLTCPAGQTTSNRCRNPNDTGWNFRFRRSQCQGCPLQAQCLDTFPKKGGRVVGTNDYQAEYDAARAKAQTPQFQEKRRLQWRIERKLGEMVRWHRARQARYRGQRKVLLQELMTAVVVNVKRVVHLLAGQRVRAELAGSQG